MITKEKKTSFCFTPEAGRLLQLLAKRMGVTKTSVIEMAIRLLAKREEVKDE
jgi:hypothetical protein